MANLNDICREMLEEIDHALAVAVVDMSSGLLLGVAHNVSYFTQSYLDALAAAATDMFRGKAITAVEKRIAQLRNEEPKHSLQEIQLSTDGTLHFMTIVPDKDEILAILVARKKINLGMGWASLRHRLGEIADTCP